MLQVTVFSTSEKKRAEALKTLKADHFVVSKDEEQMNVSHLNCVCACETVELLCNLHSFFSLLPVCLHNGIRHVRHALSLTLCM